MKRRLREVPRFSSGLLRTPQIHSDTQPYDLMSVFPLSPSDVVWGALKGCTWQRVLRKVMGITIKLPDYVLRGKVLDSAWNEFLDVKRTTHVSDPNTEELIAKIHECYHLSKHEFENVVDEEGFLTDCEGLLLALLEHEAERADPYYVQREVYLYIGEDLASPEPIERNPEHWVKGFLDWVEPGLGGYEVNDLKVTSRPIKSGRSGVGKYKFQLHTYAAALYQEGLDVNRVVLRQLGSKDKQVHPVGEDFTLKDYDRVIQIYRMIRDHYLSVLEGKSDFLVPYRGVDKCTDYQCSYFHGCDHGLGQGFDV